MKGCEADIGAACRQIREGFGPDPKADPKEFIACWSEEEVLDGKKCRAFVLILRTIGCKWGRVSGCTFCGYIADAAKDVKEQDLVDQFTNALKRYHEEPVFKIYTSGSFIDDEEVPPGFQERVLKELSALKVRRVLFETLPRFATEQKVRWAQETFKGDRGIEFALGLESADPEVLKNCVNKPGAVEDFKEASERIRSLGGKVRIYIVIKPPFLTEKEALEDAVSSAQACKGWADTISFNPINVQRGTLVERLNRRGEFQPPWLWTVMEVLRRTSKLGPRVISAPTGGGTQRGAHNCGRCDKRSLERIERFCLSGDPKDLDGQKCACQELWRDQLELEGLSHGPFWLDRRDNSKGKDGRKDH
jgi:radical SAM enzyme (TIGR01210 family)